MGFCCDRALSIPIWKDTFWHVSTSDTLVLCDFHDFKNGVFIPYMLSVCYISEASLSLIFFLSIYLSKKCGILRCRWNIFVTYVIYMIHIHTINNVDVDFYCIP